MVEFVFNEIYADGNLTEFSAKELKAISTAKILQKVGKTYANTNNGAIYEQFVIDVAKNIPGITVLSETMAEGGIPDLHVQLHGKDFFVEVKMANAQYSSITISDYDIAKGKWQIKKQYEFNDQINALVDKASEGVKAAQKFINESKIPDPKTGEAFVWKTFSQQIPTQVIQMLKNKGLYTGMSTFDVFNIDNIGEMYRGKEYPVHYIHIQGKGLFHMGDGPNPLNLPKLEGKAVINLRVIPNTQYTKVDIKNINNMSDTELLALAEKMKDPEYFRPVQRVATDFEMGSASRNDLIKAIKVQRAKSYSRIKTGLKTLTFRAIPIIPKSTLETLKSDKSIGSLARVDALVRSKEVAAMETQRKAKEAKKSTND
jgi:disulfide oxidoreductase YuzD